MDILLRMEDRYNSDVAVAFMLDRWHWSIYVSVFYVASIFAIQRWMKNRERYTLRRPLFAWSLTLALFSCLGFYVCGVTHLLHVYRKGFVAGTCDLLVRHGRPGLWAFAFGFSKMFELIDTYFIVLRKQKLIFLHWYHHITVFIYCWFHYGNYISPTQWFCTMNFFVHTVMYLYYAVRASGIYRPPIWVNMFITLLQLSQMVVGVAVNLFIYHKINTDPDWYCDGRVETTYFYVYLSLGMYLSYFVLFVHFFYTTYFQKSAKKPESQEKIICDELKINPKQVETVINGEDSSKFNGSLNGLTRRR